MDADHRLEVLRLSGMATGDGAGRWDAAAHITAQPLYRSLVAAARSSGRARHTSAEVAELLLQAGYTNPSGSAAAYHPLLRHVSYHHWEVRGTALVPQTTAVAADH